MGLQQGLHGTRQVVAEVPEVVPPVAHARVHLAPVLIHVPGAVQPRLEVGGLGGEQVGVSQGCGGVHRTDVVVD